MKLLERNVHNQKIGDQEHTDAGENLNLKGKIDVYNRCFWHTLFTCNFQVNKKAYLEILKFLLISTNISMTPIHTKK